MTNLSIQDITEEYRVFGWGLGNATIDSRFAKQILSSEMLSQYDQKRNVLNVDDGNDHGDNNECCDSYDIQ